MRKLGHAGTLDPLASGLMIVGVGPGTKKLTEYIKLDKEYEAEILVGQRRSTGDMEGEVLEEREVSENFSKEQIINLLETMKGNLKLPVSAYSAIKRGGEPLYRKVRRGEEVTELPMRDMVVYEAECLGAAAKIMEDKNFLVVRVRFEVGSGTYIRSLAEEFGRRLGYPATLASLRRTKVGDFSVSEARVV